MRKSCGKITNDLRVYLIIETTFCIPQINCRANDIKQTNIFTERLAVCIVAVWPSVSRTSSDSTVCKLAKSADLDFM